MRRSVHAQLPALVETLIMTGVGMWLFRGRKTYLPILCPGMKLMVERAEVLGNVFSQFALPCADALQQTEDAYIQRLGSCIRLAGAACRFGALPPPVKLLGQSSESRGSPLLP